MISAFPSQRCNLLGTFLRTSVHLYRNSTWLWSIDFQTAGSKLGLNHKEGLIYETYKKYDHSSWRKGHLGRAGRLWLILLSSCLHSQTMIHPVVLKGIGIKGRKYVWGVIRNACVVCISSSWAKLFLLFNCCHLKQRQAWSTHQQHDPRISWV